MLKHIVLIKMADFDTEKEKNEAMKKLKKDLDALPAKISVIKSYEVGLNISETGAAYDVSIISAFESTDDLKAYAIHQAHLEVLDYLGKVSSSKVVVDYKI